jgi:hypothetical protein
MSQELILNWLDELSESVKLRDLHRHMALVSKKVQVYGLPSNTTVDYKGWMRRRKSEFSRNILSGIKYDNLTLKAITLRRLQFQITETMHARSGKRVIIQKQIMLELEDDDKWRVVEETIKGWSVH